MNAHQRRAAALAGAISEHHRDCRTCQQGGQVAYTRRGLARVRCAAERELFAALHAAQEAGWPAS